MPRPADLALRWNNNARGEEAGRSAPAGGGPQHVTGNGRSRRLGCRLTAHRWERLGPAVKCSRATGQQYLELGSSAMPAAKGATTQ